MNILHVCAGWEKWNGAANISRLIMGEQSREGHEVSFTTWDSVKRLRFADEVWIHCAWKPCLWWAALWGRNIHWVPECSYDPIRRAYHGWKKVLVGPIERFCLRRAKTLVATCEAEKSWIQDYLGNHCPPVEVINIKRFFKLNPVNPVNPVQKPLHLLYLGRRHPLKGLDNLLAALRQFAPNIQVPSENIGQTYILTWESASPKCAKDIELKVVSNAFGDKLEKVWDWCDLLVLPTLSDNFGLVIAEALERGKRVITTDGAPAWGDGNDYGGRLVYLRGYRDGSPEDRVRLLVEAMTSLVNA